MTGETERETERKREREYNGGQCCRRSTPAGILIIFNIEQIDLHFGTLIMQQLPTWFIRVTYYDRHTEN